jgi:hypothetical protein
MQKRRIEELHNAIRLTRTSRFLYVEGKTDARILNNALIDCGRRDIDVLDVETVDFSNLPAAENPGLSSNNKLKCIKIAQFLYDKQPSIEGKVLCLVDADTDLYYDNLISNPYLVYTSHADLTLYFAQESVLRYWIPHVFGDLADTKDLLDQIKRVCSEFFRLRLALREFDAAIGFPIDAISTCSFKSGRLSVDLERLIRKLVGTMNRYAEFRKIYDRTMIRESLHDLAQMNGHDFIDVLRSMLIAGGRGRFSRNNPSCTVEALAYAGQSGALLCDTPLISTIIERISVSD